MENSLHIVGPVAFVRPRGAHRFETYSPKIGRRLTVYRRQALELWLLLEADPTVTTFCERPGYVQIDGRRRLADFWARYAGREELLVLTDAAAEIETKAADRELDGQAISIRNIDAPELAAARIWTENWHRILPYLTANRGLVTPRLSDAIQRYLRQPQRLLAIEREFSTGDPVLVRAALFGLLHCGRVGAPSLRTEPLSLLTSFVAEEATS